MHRVDNVVTLDPDDVFCGPSLWSGDHQWCYCVQKVRICCPPILKLSKLRPTLAYVVYAIRQVQLKICRTDLPQAILAAHHSYVLETGLIRSQVAQVKLYHTPASLYLGKLALYGKSSWHGERIKISSVCPLVVKRCYGEIFGPEGLFPGSECRVRACIDNSWPFTDGIVVDRLSRVWWEQVVIGTWLQYFERQADELAKALEGRGHDRCSLLMVD